MSEFKVTDQNEKGFIQVDRIPERPMQDERFLGGSLEDVPAGEVIIRGNETEYKTFKTETVNPSEQFKSPFTGKVMSTAKHPSTNRPVASVDKNTIVSIKGIQTSAEVAANMGYLIQNADGTYREAETDPTEAKAQQQQQQPESVHNDFTSSNVRDFLNKAGQRVGNQQHFDLMASRVIGAHFVGNADPGIKDLAFALKMQPDETTDLMSKVSADILNNARSYVNKNVEGITGAELFNWVDNLEPASKASVVQRLYHGDKSVINDLVAKWRKGEKY